MQVQNTIILTKSAFQGSRRNRSGKSRNDRRYLGKRLFYLALGVRPKCEIIELFKLEVA